MESLVNLLLESCVSVVNQSSGMDVTQALAGDITIGTLRACVFMGLRAQGCVEGAFLKRHKTRYYVFIAGYFYHLWRPDVFFFFFFLFSFH